MAKYSYKQGLDEYNQKQVYEMALNEKRKILEQQIINVILPVKRRKPNLT
jgi:hypothetical protein